MSVVETELVLPDLRLPRTPVPALRLLPAPETEPPFDDAARPEAPRLVPLGTAVQTALPPVPLRLVPPPGVPDDLDDEDAEPPTRTPLAQLPPPRPFAHALVQRLLEVSAGLRPLHQLERDTSCELYEVLAQRLGGAPGRRGPRPDRRSVRSVHVQPRADGSAEVCATVVRGPRATAVALRLEGHRGRWRCTELVGL